MVFCTVAYVRSKISTTQTDEVILNIIDETSSDVLLRCGTTDETNPTIILAGKYAILAAVLSRAKTTGELAASVNTGNAQRQNTTDVDIERYEKKSEYYISQYTSSSSYSFSSYSNNFSISGNNHCRGHHGFN